MAPNPQVRGGGPSLRGEFLPGRKGQPFSPNPSANLAGAAKGLSRDGAGPFLLVPRRPAPEAQPVVRAALGRCGGFASAFEPEQGGQPRARTTVRHNPISRPPRTSPSQLSRYRRK